MRKLIPIILSLLSATRVHATTSINNKIVVVGSMNVDTFLPVARLPTEGENIMLLPGRQPIVDVPGGKGCTQAVAAAKLVQHDDRNVVEFVGQFGNDGAANMLRQTLEDAGVRIASICSQPHQDLPSGRGYVFLSEDGSVSAVVSGGSNQDGWGKWKETWEAQAQQKKSSSKSTSETTNDNTLLQKLDHLLENTQCVMLQREVPEYVNLLVAHAARRRGILVLQDIGGEGRSMSRDMMEVCDYLMPNESEFRRLVRSILEEENDASQEMLQELDNTVTNLPEESILKMVQLLQSKGARNVLITRGRRGSMLITEGGEVYHQPAFPLEASDVVDETGAGDCYRAAFAVALLEGYSRQECLEYASAAGCCSVQKQGAVPSTPSRELVEEWFHKIRATDNILNIPRGAGDNKFPFLIGSRLNSMKDRPELWMDGPLNNARDFVQRQANIKGLTCVDFNYPQHFGEGVWSSTEDARLALEKAGLVAGAVCLRYPGKFARGAMNNPDLELRRQAIQLTKEAARLAKELGCDEVVVWSAYDGYDYPFQVDYDSKWQELVEAFRECCDAYPEIKFSLEYKPTDENTRFFTVPSTAAALLLVEEIDRPNMGLTLDVGHMLMSGESPGQSIAMVGRKQKLFGVQLNDGYTRLAAEDGMMFGSIHPSLALEVMHQLRRTNFKGHLYFDTFPQRTDPIKEAEYNIQRVKKFWSAAVNLDETKLREAADNHDAIQALELVDEALRSHL